MTADPLSVSDLEFSAAMNELDDGGGLALAVSGGGDSMALAVLAKSWAFRHGRNVCAFIVDHRLRAGSAAEAESVRARVRALDIPATILTWDDASPGAHLQERARDARYALLARACAHEGIRTLALAHNLEDQAETFWMRLAHGSGLDGLCGMARTTVRDGIRIVRPLLPFPRARLRATCRAANVEWVDDPSNRDERFLRTRLRAFEDMLAGEGLTPQRLTETMRKLTQAADLLRELTREAAGACLEFCPEGYVRIQRAAFDAQPAEIRRRLLAQALLFANPAPYPPESEGVDRVCARLSDAAEAGCTLAGCEIVTACDDIFILREAAAMAPPVPLLTGAVWDRRFYVEGVADESLMLGALGEQADEALRKNQAFAALPFKIRRTLPAVLQGQNLVAVPHLGYKNADFSAALSALQIVACGRKAV